MPNFMAVCQKWDNLIRQGRAEQAAQKTGRGMIFPCSAKPPPSLMDLTTAPAETMAGYTWPAAIDLGAGKRRISSEERANRFTDRRCLYCGGFNHTAAEWTARKSAQMVHTAGAEVNEVGTRSGLESKGKELVNCARMIPQVTRKVAN